MFHILNTPKHHLQKCNNLTFSDLYITTYLLQGKTSGKNLLKPNETESLSNVLT